MVAPAGRNRRTRGLLNREGALWLCSHLRMGPVVMLASCMAITTSPSSHDPVVARTAACAALPAAGVAHEHAGAWNAAAPRPIRRVVIMGGSTEVDAASRSFVEAAAGGDVMVLRASGSTSSYNGYFGRIGADPAPSWVGSVRIDSVAQASDAALLCRVAHAEAIWLAGGNQWNYLGRWPAVLHDSLRTAATRRVAIGGTSAGAMSLGELAFDARAGSAVSDSALLNPFHPDVTVSRSPMAQPELAGAIVDTHFMQRNREGRLLAFLAQGRELLRSDALVGIGLDERTALVIEGGRFRVHTGTADRHVWIYRVSGAMDLRPGTPLSLQQVERVRLSNGTSGNWPLHFQDWQPELMQVDNGVVLARGRR